MITFHTYPTAAKNVEIALEARLRGNRIHLPPYPAVVAKLQHLAQEKRANAAEVGRIVAADAALCAVVFNRARSAAMRGAAPIESLDAAIFRIGIDELIRIALASKLGPSASAAGPLAALRRDMWRRSLISARIALELARPRGIGADDAFVGGLLHDFGAIALVAGLEELAADHELPVLGEPVWRTLIHKRRHEFGQVVAARWDLPPRIKELITGAAPQAPLGVLMALVDRIVTALDRAPVEGADPLHEFTELDAAERAHIPAALPETVRFMAELEQEVRPSAEVASHVEPEKFVEPSWPAALDVMTRSHCYRTTSLSATTLVMTGPEPLMANWVAPMILQTDFEPIDILANVRACKKLPDGSYEITAQPFGLAGPPKAAWLYLLAKTRPAGAAASAG
ncbi:MAG TPA: HDOD domain-containing protein [Kofleriaceae bacterium]|nr:HDOD domain-containing protein [Kofleriaceae bacterium]